MDRLQIWSAGVSANRAKAMEDARQMQAIVIEACNKAGKIPPKYKLEELIGKGSFGRVFKSKDMTTGAYVAVKIIDIDESDTLNPRQADAYSEFLKEVTALKTMSENKARNINHVIEALPVMNAMWMITEYCGGGSVATLMTPTKPGGLQEKWIIPIVREVAEAVKWVHEAGIIHRDIKCANVLITEEGGVQLCDFGVAGTMESKLDKRSTIIGTPHWMAPELFGPSASYGKEVDIWAFGSLIFEIASGMPPNAKQGISFERLGSYLKQHIPRLEGGDYSSELRSIVAYCLEEIPSARPTIEDVQRHAFIYNTSAQYPTSSLLSLIKAFKMWEVQGGYRKSLFIAGGAQGPSEASAPLVGEEWNFSTTQAFDENIVQGSSMQDVYEAYGTQLEMDSGFSEGTARPSGQQKGRRRPPPEALAPIKAPLEKIFDGNTMSNYEDNSRVYYGRPQPPPTSDLPLRDDTAQTSIRDTLIDLDLTVSPNPLSAFADMGTIKANRTNHDDESDDYESGPQDFSRPALSDPADVANNRRTRDWKFPSMQAPLSADPETSQFPSAFEFPIRSRGVAATLEGRPPLIHHPTEPIGIGFDNDLGGLGAMDGMNKGARMSTAESLIDLDMSLPDPVTDFNRPSTAVSEAGSATSEQMGGSNPFEFERLSSQFLKAENQQEPEIYVSGESTPPTRLLRNENIVRMGDDMSIPYSDAEALGYPTYSRQESTMSAFEASPQHPSGITAPNIPPEGGSRPYVFPAVNDSTFRMPPIPAPPSLAAMTGQASREEMAQEMRRMLAGLTEQLEAFRQSFESPAVKEFARKQREAAARRRRDEEDDKNGGATGAGINGDGSGRPGRSGAPSSSSTTTKS